MAGTRERIVEAADQLFYQQGFEKTSFADIADVVAISRGNFYYHFKTKDEILDAVIQQRLANTHAMIETWDAGSDSPKERLRSFIRILMTNGAKIKKYGCPIGTLSSELAKLNHQAQGDANALFTLFRQWLSRQFEAMGQGEHADQLALHLLARSQGAATLYQAFQDEDFIKQEVSQLEDWLDTLGSE
jgi:AcrR family transcriptional regulator